MPVTHEFTIICDEVRREDNGKLMVLGMYNEIVILPQLPYVLPSLTFLTFLSSDRLGMYSVKVKLQHLETGRNLVEGHGSANFSKPGILIAPLRFGNVQFQAAGTYNFVREIEGSDPILTSFTVVLGATMTQHT